MEVLTVASVISIAIHQGNLDATFNQIVQCVDGDFERITRHAEKSVYDIRRADAKVQRYTERSLHPVLVHVSDDVVWWEDRVLPSGYIERVALACVSLVAGAG